MSQLFQELKRRNVFRVAIAYLAVAWLVIQVSDIVLDNIAAPEWLMKALLFFLAIGFPIAILFAWAYEMTPDKNSTLRLLPCWSRPMASCS